MKLWLRGAAALLLIFLLTLSGTSMAQAQADASGQGPTTAILQGRVFGADRVTPVSGAVVRAVRGDGVQVYSSLPTDSKGAYTISNIALGSYDIVVEVSDGIFVVEKTLGVTEAKTYGLSLANVPSESVEKRVAAIDKPVKGYAWTLEGNTPKGGFWKSPGGIAIIAGGAAAILALILSNGGDDNNNNGGSSPSTP
jgi:hypothetical protein